jgi:hypothetical protein
MAMIAGSATISINTTTGAITTSGTGMAKALADAEASAMMTLSAYNAWLASFNCPPVAAADYAKALEFQRGDRAARANAYAAALVTYLQANAVAHVTTESLGKTPNPNNADTPIVAPASPVDIPIQ